MPDRTGATVRFHRFGWRVWIRVMRGGDRGAPDIFGIVCPTCFILRAEAASVEATGWLVQPEVINA